MLGMLHHLNKFAIAFGHTKYEPRTQAFEEKLLLLERLGTRLGTYYNTINLYSLKVSSNAVQYFKNCPFIESIQSKSSTTTLCSNA